MDHKTPHQRAAELGEVINAALLVADILATSIDEPAVLDEPETKAEARAALSSFQANLAAFFLDPATPPAPAP